MDKMSILRDTPKRKKTLQGREPLSKNCPADFMDSIAPLGLQNDAK